MARFAAYHGPVAPVSTVVEQGTYSLSALAQSNAGGWGIGWYPNDGEDDAVRLISRAPLWTDQHHLALVDTTNRAIIRQPRTCTGLPLQPVLLSVGAVAHAPRYVHHVAGMQREVAESFDPPLLRSMQLQGEYIVEISMLSEPGSFGRGEVGVGLDRV